MRVRTQAPASTCVSMVTTGGDSRCFLTEHCSAARITAVPGPAFTIEHFTMVSCESGQWQPAGAPEPFEFTPPDEETSVELPVG